MNADGKKSPPRLTEDPGLKTGFRTVPLWLVFLFALVFCWGLVYANDHGGGFDSKVYQPYRDYAQLTGVQPPTNRCDELIREGAKVFSSNCESCHQATGMGSPVNHCPPLARSEWVDGHIGPNRTILLILYGGQGPISVLGRKYDPGSTVMPAFSQLTDREIAAVLSYVRNSWGNEADCVTPETVAEIHAKEKAVGWSGYRHAEELLEKSDKD